MKEFKVADYRYLAQHFFTDTYPGYRKAGFEQPDSGYGSGYDYTHIAPKYLHEWDGGKHTKTTCMMFLMRLLRQAQETAYNMGIPPDFVPVMEDSTLRLLRYPPGTVSNAHTDFCLFTRPLWRNTWVPYVAEGQEGSSLHIGELTTKLIGIPSTVHEVKAYDRWQYSAVYFAMPALDCVLPEGLTVKEWLDVRKKETRG